MTAFENSSCSAVDFVVVVMDTWLRLTSDVIPCEYSLAGSDMEQGVEHLILEGIAAKFTKYSASKDQFFFFFITNISKVARMCAQTPKGEALRVTLTCENAPSDKFKTAKVFQRT